MYLLMGLLVLLPAQHLLPLYRSLRRANRKSECISIIVLVVPKQCQFKKYKNCFVLLQLHLMLKIFVCDAWLALWICLRNFVPKSLVTVYQQCILLPLYRSLRRANRKSECISIIVLVVPKQCQFKKYKNCFVLLQLHLMLKIFVCDAWLALWICLRNFVPKSLVTVYQPARGDVTYIWKHDVTL